MSIEFDSINDYVDTQSRLFNGLTKFTISAWVYIPTSIGVNLMIYGSGSDVNFDNAKFFIRADGSMDLLVGDGAGSFDSTSNDGPTLSTDTWHHLAFTWDGVNYKRYLDGVNSGTNDASTIAAISIVNDEFIGANNQDGSPQLFWKGKINELAIYDMNLSDDQIARLANSKKKREPARIQLANLLAYWPINDGPNGESADTDTVKDMSLDPATKAYNGNDGVGVGGTWKAEEVLSYPGDPIYVVESEIPVGITMPIIQQNGIHSTMFGGGIVQ